MSTHHTDSFNNSPFLNFLYSLSPNITSKQIAERIDACLGQAEALVTVAATVDFDCYSAEIIGNYLWAVCERLREVRWLRRAMNCEKSSAV
jgi:hypothetical protein